MTLFSSKGAKEYSVAKDFNIDCSAFTDHDWLALARMVDYRLRGKYSHAVGTNNNGVKFAQAINMVRVRDPNGKAPEAGITLPRLVCHDVWATGEVLMRILQNDDLCLCVFSRPEFGAIAPDNVIVLFPFNHGLIPDAVWNIALNNLDDE